MGWILEQKWDEIKMVTTSIRFILDGSGNIEYEWALELGRVET